MELLDDINKLVRAYIDFKHLSEGCTGDGVKSLVEKLRSVEKLTKITYTMTGAALLPSLGAAEE